MHKMTVNAVANGLSYAAISKRVYGGEVLAFAGGGTPLLRAARQLCREVFETAQIEKAHEQFSRAEFLRRAAQAQEAFNGAPYKELFAGWLAHLGIRPAEELYWDTLGLRIAAPVESHGGGFRSHVSVHRDTWGSGIQAQVNWWAPLMPLSYGRTLAFYPHYWERALPNSTAEWSFKDYLASRRAVRSSGKAADYPAAPRHLAEPETPPYLVKLRCGELLAFSSAHLHASVPNRTLRTRFSLEIRTVHAQDVRQGRGAPNVDCASEPPLYQLFRAVGDDARKLSQDLNP